MKNILDKLMSRGAVSLSNGELLVLLAEDETMGKALLADCGGSLATLVTEDIARLRMRQGMGLKRAQRFAVAAEFGRRVVVETAGKAVSISTSDDVVALFRPQLKDLRYEECWVLYLTSSNRILEQQPLSRGGVQGTVVDYRLIVKHALELLATQIVMVHNHPSGLAEPSSQDKELTSKVQEAAGLFDIRLLDHLIISRSGHFSFRQEGLLKK